MRFKNLIGSMVFAVILFACDAPKKEEAKQVKEPVMEKKEQTTTGVTRFEALNGYFVKNDVKFDKDIIYAVVTGQGDFDKYFGIAKTMDNKPTALNFDKFNVAAIMLKPSKKAQKINLGRYTAEGAKQIVEFNIETGADQSFTSGGLLLFKIPKSKTSVDFVTGGQTTNIEVN